MARGTVTFLIRAKNATGRQLKRVRAEFQRLGVAARKGLSVAAGAVTGLAVAMASLFAIGRKVYSAYSKQVQAEAKLASVLRATGGAAGYTISELVDLAGQLQKTTGIGDETILSMQGILASFKNIRGDVFRDATEAILDMSVVMLKAGKSQAEIEQTSVQVGKALNDPIKGMTALSRVGVTFTDQQREMVKYYQENNKLAAAQAIVLRELKGEFGGAAAGQDKQVLSMKALANEFGDMLELFGAAIFESEEFASGLGYIRAKLSELANSGEIDSFVGNLAAGFEAILPIINGVAKGLSFVADGIRYVSIAAGSLAGGSTIEDASKAAFLGTGERGKRQREMEQERAKAEREARKRARIEDEKDALEFAKRQRKIEDEENAAEYRLLEEQIKREKALKDAAAQAEISRRKALSSEIEKLELSNLGPVESSFRADALSSIGGSLGGRKTGQDDAVLQAQREQIRVMLDSKKALLEIQKNTAESASASLETGQRFA